MTGFADTGWLGAPEMCKIQDGGTPVPPRAGCPRYGCGMAILAMTGYGRDARATAGRMPALRPKDRLLM
jgi:hypothetical protein